MPKSKIQQVRCAFCPCLKDSQEGCKCYCHESEKELSLEEPKPQWDLPNNTLEEILDENNSE